MGVDEAGTLAALRAHRSELIDAKIAAFGGRIVKTMGDGLLLEFPSVVDATQCVIDVQLGMAERNADVDDDRRIVFRVGINLGDIIIEGDDILGDGVNIAARLQEIAEAGGVCISNRVHDDVRDRLDTVFADGGAQTLKNIARPVHVWQWAPEAIAVAESAPLPLPDKPSIAVLPFDNLSHDPEQDYFADGITEDIITGLATLSWLFVIARNSTFTYKGQAVDIKQVGVDLGVRYVLEGSVRKAGQRVRVTAQLIEAATGNHVWAERFDGQIEDIFELQDEITAKIVSALGPEMTMAEIERRRNRPRANYDAWDFYLQARPHHHAVTEADFNEAVALLNKSMAADPGFASAPALLGLCYVAAALHGWVERPRDAIAIARRHARDAIAMEPLNALGHAALGMSYHFRGPMDEAAAAFERALELEPNNTLYWTHLSSALCFAGRPEEAIAAAEKAARGSPRDPEFWHVSLSKASAYFVAGRLEDSVREAKHSARLQPNFYASHSFLAAAAALLGRQAEAEASAKMLLQLVPRFNIKAVQRNPLFERPEDLAHMIEGLRLAGIPEG